MLGIGDKLYKEDCFTLRIESPENYPNGPPKFLFLRLIYHPDVISDSNNKSGLGYISEDFLNDNNLSAFNFWKRLYWLFAIFCFSFPSNDFSNQKYIEKMLYSRIL